MLINILNKNLKNISNDDMWKLPADLIRGDYHILTDATKPAVTDIISEVQKEYLPLVIGAAGVLILIGGTIGYFVGKRK